MGGSGGGVGGGGGGVAARGAALAACKHLWCIYPLRGFYAKPSGSAVISHRLQDKRCMMKFLILQIYFIDELIELVTTLLIAYVYTVDTVYS